MQSIKAVPLGRLALVRDKDGELAIRMSGLKPGDAVINRYDSLTAAQADKYGLQGDARTALDKAFQLYCSVPSDTNFHFLAHYTLAYQAKYQGKS